MRFIADCQRLTIISLANKADVIMEMFRHPFVLWNTMYVEIEDPFRQRRYIHNTRFLARFP